LPHEGSSPNEERSATAKEWSASERSEADDWQRSRSGRSERSDALKKGYLNRNRTLERHGEAEPDGAKRRPQEYNPYHVGIFCKNFSWNFQKLPASLLLTKCIQIMIEFKIIGETSSNPCVFRIEAGTKYFIWKSPDIFKTLKSLSKDLDVKIKNCKPDDLFYKLVTHICQYRTFKLSAKVLFETENHAELVKFEMDILAKAEKDPHCVNVSFLPYQPKWINLSENKAISATLPKSKLIAPVNIKSIKEPVKKQEKTADNSKTIPAENKTLPIQKGVDLESVKEALAKLKKIKENGGKKG